MNINLERQLRKHMSQHDIDFDPVDRDFSTDCNRHIYEVRDSTGSITQAWYMAFYVRDKNAKIFVCTYGLLNEPKTYTFSKLINDQGLPIDNV